MSCTIILMIAYICFALCAVLVPLLRLLLLAVVLPQCKTQCPEQCKLGGLTAIPTTTAVNTQVSCLPHTLNLCNSMHVVHYVACAVCAVLCGRTSTQRRAVFASVTRQPCELLSNPIVVHMLLI